MIIKFAVIATIIFLLLVLKMLYDNRKKDNNFIRSSSVSQKYVCNEGNFIVSGNKKKFTIKKNGQIEFLIKDGQIIASRDLRVGKEYKYYGVKENGTI